MVKVYFETSSYCHQAAIFDDEETYNACLPALEKLREKNRFEYISESVEDADMPKALKDMRDSELIAELERRGYEF